MPAEFEAMTLEELRHRRDRVRGQEEAVSYRRRLLHAQLDIVQASMRAAGPAEFEAMLADVLSDDAPSSAGEVRAVEVEDEHDDVDLAPLPVDLLGISDDDRAAVLARLREDERATSARRQELLQELDALQDELVRRYRRDGVDARELLREDG